MMAAASAMVMGGALFALRGRLIAIPIEMARVLRSYRHAIEALLRMRGRPRAERQHEHQRTEDHNKPTHLARR